MRSAIRVPKRAAAGPAFFLFALRGPRGRAVGQYASIPGVTGRAGEGDGVAHIGEAGDVGEGALEAEAEAGVRHRAVAPQIAVPGVLVLVDAALGHGLVQDVEPLFALAAAD